MKQMSARPLVAFGVGAMLFASGCATHHWAPVEATPLPPPPGEKVLHTDRLVVQITNTSQENQCVVYQDKHPLCFYNVDNALKSGLLRSLWPAFPEVVLGTAKSAGPSDYLLQVEVTLDALPPDESGPGWSAGARSRYRLFRGGEVISEQTMASRSRAHFAYGAPLGEGATEVINATIIHLAQLVSEVPESRPDTPVPLPAVATRDVTSEKSTKRSKEKLTSPKIAAQNDTPHSQQAKSEN